MLPIGCVESCRGCKHREYSAEESLAQKLSFLNLKLESWTNVLEPVRSVEKYKRWGYRSKTTLSAIFNDTSWEFGMWQRDILIPIPGCPVHSPKVNRILELIRTSIPQKSNFALAFVVISGAQVVLVVKSKLMPETSWITNDFTATLTDLGVEGFWIHLNPSAGRRIFEKISWHLIWGIPRSIDINGLLYGPAAFQQLIPELYNQSLHEAFAFLDITEKSSVVDLYCGTGNSMKKWIDSNANVIGIELSGEAIECAKLNVPTATILRGACRQRIPQVKSWVENQRDIGQDVLLYANPPRTGLEVEVLDWIVNDGRPSKIAYLSCSPGTLSKNLHTLSTNGYKVDRLIPFDFFPQTIHVECLALLALKH